MLENEKNSDVENACVVGSARWQSLDAVIIPSNLVGLENKRILRLIHS